MESLLRLSGLLSEDDDGQTDLGTLEKKLAEKGVNGGDKLESGSPPTDRHHRSPSAHVTTQKDSQQGLPSPASVVASPDATSGNKNEEEVEHLSDMMCSLVTNNCGETRFIGRLLRLYSHRSSIV